MPSIARKNLFEDLPRFLVAQAGIMFAVSLVTIQTGIFQGVIRSTALLIDHSRADIWVGSEDTATMEMTLQIPYERLSQAKKVSGVEVAEAIILNGSMWRDSLSQINHIRVVGFDPDGQLLVPGNVTKGNVYNLRQFYTIMVDEASLRVLNVRNIGDVVEVGAFRARVAGMTQDTQPIVTSPFLFTSLKTALAYVTSRPADKPPKLSAPDPRPLTSKDQITFVLVRASPGQDLQKLKLKLEDALPHTRAYTREEMANNTRAYWQKRTGIGFVLGLGAAVGIIVGMVVVGQILYSSVSDHLKEFGTLKAMGASDWVIYDVIVEQALWMAILGYLPGMALCFGVKTWALSAQGLVILITPTTAAVVFCITVAMCVSSAIFAIQKVNRVDPAIVFKA